MEMSLIVPVICLIFAIHSDSQTTTTKVPCVNPAQVNWCDSKLLGNKKAHLACKNSGKFSSSCLKPRIIDMSDSLESFVLKVHNEFRNSVAGGKLPVKSPQLPKAPRMLTMEWNAQLEYLASLNCKVCKMHHDSDSILTPQFTENVGQNIAIAWKWETQEKTNVTMMLKDSMDDWTDEIVNIRSEIFTWTACKKDPNQSSYGHAGIMMSDGVSQIGCSVCQFTDFISGSYPNATSLICNYGGDLTGVRPYEVGKSAGTCKTGQNPTYKYLCAVAENNL